MELKYQKDNLTIFTQKIHERNIYQRPIDWPKKENLSDKKNISWSSNTQVGKRIINLYDTRIMKIYFDNFRN